VPFSLHEGYFYSLPAGIKIAVSNKIIRMAQLSLFGEAGQSKGLPTALLSYRPGVFGAEESNLLMQHFIATTPWQQKLVTMYDKKILTPRLTAWYGNPQAFDYSALGKLAPLPWTKELLFIKSTIEALAGITFNSVLLNYYRDGNDSVAWHSDNENVLGRHPVIASISFGQVRNFDIRNKKDHAEKYSIRLENGSYLLMKGDLQENWEHRIAKSTKPLKARVNLTFRVVL
jgi:alkylated DNA repair dioxygenase AlkB